MPAEHPTPGIITESQNEMDAQQSGRARRHRWRLAELAGEQWFMAEEICPAGSDARRFLSMRLRDLAPLLKEQPARWRCFAYLASSELRVPIFDEIVSVTDLSGLGGLVFRFRGGLIGMESYGVPRRNFVGPADERPSPVIHGERVFEWNGVHLKG